MTSSLFLLNSHPGVEILISLQIKYHCVPAFWAISKGSAYCTVRYTFFLVSHEFLEWASGLLVALYRTPIMSIHISIRLCYHPSITGYTGTLATGIEVQNKTDTLLPNKRILYSSAVHTGTMGITTCNSDHRLQSITAAHIWELL